MENRFNKVEKDGLGKFRVEAGGSNTKSDRLPSTTRASR